MIDLEMYLMGRDTDPRYAALLTDRMIADANVTVDRANQLLEQFGDERTVNSGWRPPAVNANTPNASATSLHMVCQAVDLHDPNGDLDSWCLKHLDVLAGIGLWLESPDSTPGWSHVQIVAPHSGNRVFLPR